jgi:FkbM family methyltransferase
MKSSLMQNVRGFLSGSTAHKRAMQPIDIRPVRLLGEDLRFATTTEDKVLSAMLRGEEPLCRFYQAELAWMKDELKPGDKVLEAGGNIGSVAIALALHQPTSHVVSFEPDPMNFGLFQMNLALNGCNNVQSFNMALGDHDGFIQLYRSPFNFGDHRTAKPKGLDLEETKFRELPNPVALVKGSRFLGEVLPGWQADLLKVDTQGADFEILGDLVEVLAPKARVGIEYSPYHLDTNGTTFAHVVSVLEKFEKIFRIQPTSPPGGYTLSPITIAELERFFDEQKPRYDTYFDLALYK